MDVSKGFEALIDSCLQLLDAGYPDAMVVSTRFKRVVGMRENLDFTKNL